HPGGPAVAVVPAVLAGGQRHHAPLRRHGGGGGDFRPAGRDDGRADRGHEGGGGGGGGPHLRALRRRGRGGAGGGGRGAPARGGGVRSGDETATNRRILEETAVAWGCRPTMVDGGPAALAALDEAAQAGEPFVLALIDAHMPDMDGFMLAEEVQRRPELAGLTLLMLTSGGQPGDVARCRALGVTCYLTKPVRQKELRKSIMTALGADGTTDSARGKCQPVRAPAATGNGPQPAAPRHLAALRPLRILLVEDNPVNQKLALGILQKAGHNVAVANDGHEALA